MIAVIADDFTGAAEIGGIGLLYGYKTAIVRQVKQIPDVELLVIATEMRALESEEAALVSERITKELLKLKPEFIFKKIDSVLRGHIVSELEAQMKLTSQTTALIIPANPNLNRTIKEGIYYVEGRPLLESKFAEDFSFKTKSSKVLDIIGKSNGLPIANISHYEKLPDQGLLIGNTLNTFDLHKWAEKVDNKMLPTGASGFFGAILERHGGIKGNYDQSPFIKDKKALYICGSNFPMSKKSVMRARENGYTVISMPDGIYYDAAHNIKLIHRWAQDIIKAFESDTSVIVSVLQQPDDSAISGKQIKHVLATLVKLISDTVDIDELLIEGGSTAYNITEKLNINVFYPVQAFAPGVTRMEVANKKKLLLTVKPGSYVWPKSIWKFDIKIKS
ncbi:MAG: four-carbon acid sugar kinase family protein [Flavobacteriaceae bacterium]|nr:four-carbon acid sugar kinase family protein [Flavobacteriaceae bacterium]